MTADGTEFWAPCDSVGSPIGVWSAADTVLNGDNQFFGSNN